MRFIIWTYSHIIFLKDILNIFYFNSISTISSTASDLFVTFICLFGLLELDDLLSLLNLDSIDSWIFRGILYDLFIRAYNWFFNKVSSLQEFFLFVRILWIINSLNLLTLWSYNKVILWAIYIVKCTILRFSHYGSVVRFDLGTMKWKSRHAWYNILIKWLSHNRIFMW